MSRSKFKQQKICKDKYAIYVLLCFFVRMFLLIFFHFFLGGGGGSNCNKNQNDKLKYDNYYRLKRRFNFQKNVKLKLILYDI